MKNIKNIVIGIFAVIGFAAIVTGFTNESVQEHTVPESHVWEMVGASSDVSFLYNKQTGEVRKYPVLGIEWYSPRQKVLKQKK